MDRVVYENNPLVRVVARIHFEPLLEIASNSPVNFHKQIRADYPFVDSEEASQGSLGDIEYYDFVGREGTWRIRFGWGFLQLETSEYERWEEFSNRLERVCIAFQEEYDPVCSHIQISYLDIINPAQLEALDDDTPWSDLLSDAWFQGSETFVEDGKLMEQSNRIELDAERNHRARLSLEIEPDGFDERVAWLQNDFTKDFEAPEASDERLVEAFDELHAYPYPIFRRSITERLHNTLGPNSP